MKAVVCIALTGIASTAMAQSASLNIVASQSVVDPTLGTATVTLSLSASADFGTHIAGGEFALVGDTDTQGLVAGMEASAAAWGAFGENDRGWAGGTAYTGLVFGQLIAPPFFPPSEDSNFAGGEVLLGTIQVEIDSPQFWGLHFQAGAGLGPFVLEIFDEADGSLTQLTAGDVSFGSASIQVVPTPASLGLISIGGLVAARRRR
ncbi:MAG: hypothetical protein ACSHX5_05415 [Phycisphaerales bacterium]